MKKLEKDLGIDIDLVKRVQHSLVETNASAHDIDYVTGVLSSQPKGIELCTEKDLQNSVKVLKENLENLIPIATKILTSIKKAECYGKEGKNKKSGE